MTRRIVSKYRAHLLPLEPRMMFDAAAVAVVREAMADPGDGFAHTDDAAAPNPAAAPATDRSPSDNRLALRSGEQRTAVSADPADDGAATREPDAVADRDAHAARLTDWRALAPSDPSPPSNTAIIFIDTSVADYRQLADEWAGQGEVVLIDGTRDGIDQMRAALAGRSDISAIHIVSHGSAGVLQLGTTRIDGSAIAGSLASSLAAIGRTLTADGDILIYGCDFAAGADGARTLAAFARATGADVAASTDTTGYAARGGDWTLEAHEGAVEAYALSSRDWVHTLDPNTPVPISVQVGSLTVKDAGGNDVFSAANNNYNSDAARSPDVGVGAVATWANAATYQGRSIDLKATIVALTSGDAVQFNRVTGTGSGPDDPTFLLRDLTSGNTPATVQIRWELVDHATGEALPADIRFTIADIDGIGGDPHTRETVIASTDHLAYFTRERLSDIHFTSSLNAIEASGTQDENNPVGATLTPKSAATFDWTKVSAFTLTYTLAPNAQTTNAQFYHDGDADFAYSDPVYVSIPRLDLDGDDSTATGNDAHFTFTEDGAGVPVVDSDVVVSNPMDINSITGAQVTLTNYRGGDTFTVGTLPGNVTASIGTPSNGTLTITFSGLGSEADYAAALKAVRYSNTSDTPDTTQRVVNVSFSNDTLTSAVATSRIDVIPVNDAPRTNPTIPYYPVKDGQAVSVSITNVFYDPDGDPLTYGASGLPAGVSLNPATGIISGTVDRSASQVNGGHYTVVLTATDPSGASASRTVNVTVTNPPPSASNDSATTAEDTPTTINVLGNDSDPDGDPLTVTSASALHGTVVRNGDGTLTYTPNANYNGSDTISYTISDGEGGSSSATVAVTVTPVNDPVVASGSLSDRTSQDAATVSYATAGGFSDPDGDALSYSAVGLPTGLTIDSATGVISGTIDRSASQTGVGHYTIAVTARDPSNTAATQTFTLTVTNPAPDAVDDSATTALNTPITITVLTNDSDPDGDPLTVTAASAAHGTVTINPDGTLRYTPATGFIGSDTIAYTISDGQGGTDSAVVAVEVANRPPVANPDRAATVEDGPVTIAVLSNDSDPDGDPLTVTAASALHGTVVRNADGTLTYTPDANYNGTDTISYTVGDGRGGTASSTVAVRIAPQPDPVSNSVPGAQTIAEDGALVFSTANGNALAIADADGGDQTVTITVTRGTFTLNGVTGLTFSAGDGNADATMTFTGRVGAINAALQNARFDPAADANGAAQLTMTTASVPVEGEDFQNGGGESPYVADGQFAQFSGAQVPGWETTASDDKIEIWGNGYHGVPAYAGRQFFEINGTEPATLYQDLRSVAGSPVSVAFAHRGRAGTDVMRLTATDLGADGVYGTADDVVLLQEDFSDGNTAWGAYARQLTAAASGNLIRVGFTAVSTANNDPAAGNLLDGVVLTQNAPATTDTDTVAISITPVVDIAPDSVTTAEDTPVTYDPFANDSFENPGRTLTQIDGQSIVAGGAAVAVANGQVALGSDGRLTFTPAANYHGTTTYTYTVTSNGAQETATETVTVTSVNDAPVAVGTLPARTANDAGSVTIATAGGFSDPDGDPLRYSATGLPAGLTIDAATGVISGTLGRSASQVAGGLYTITVTATDPSSASRSQSFTLTVANPAPTAVDDNAGTAEDTPVTIAVLPNDSDPDGDPLTVTAASALHGTVVRNADGTLTYTPSANYSGADTISYTISDGEGGAATASVAVAVGAVNDAPVAGGTLPARSAADGSAVSFGTAGGFSDPDGDQLSYSATGLPAGLAIDPTTGVVSGTLDRSASQIGGGSYEVTVTARDPGGLSRNQTFAFTATNPPPNAANDSANTAEDTAVTIAVLANDSDPDGDPLTVTAASALHGSVVRNADGTLTYTPDADYNGADTLTYTISDGQGGTATATVAVTIDPVNDAPTTTGLPPRTNLDGETVSIPVADAFHDVDGGPLTYTATGLPPGLGIDPATGAITGAIASGSNVGGPDGDGRFPVTITATDPQGASVAARFDYRVTQAPPTARDDTAITVEDTAATIPVLANDSDPDNDPLTIVAATADHGTVAIAGGDLIFTPAPDFAGVATLTYTVADPSGNRATATVAVTVTPVNDAPRSSVIPAQTSRDGQATILDAGAFFTDPEGDALRYAATGLPPGLTIDPLTGRITGTITHDASAVAGGVYLVTVSANDGERTTAAGFDWAVTNPPPVAADDNARTAEDTAVVVPVLANDSDPDGDPLTVVAARAEHGTATIGGDGRLTYTPGPNFAGNDTIVYTISDGNGGQATATVTVTVDPVNDAPVVPPQDGAIDAVSGMPLTIDALREATDPDGDPIRIVDATTANGIVTINPDGTLQFTPAYGFVGAATIGYRVADGQGGFIDAVLVVQVRAPAAADVEQLLRIGRVTFVDPTPHVATVIVPHGPGGGEVRNPLSLLDAVEGIRGLNATGIGRHAIGDAVDAVRPLDGTAIDPDQPITAEVARLERLSDHRDAGDRLYDHRWSDFQVKSLTGFSAAADRNAGVMVESVVRDGAIYVEVRDIAQDGRAAIRSVDVRTATGGRVPAWIKVDRRGLAIIERGADADELHVIVRVTRDDGRTSNTPIVIQGATGEIELDRHRPSDRAAPLAHTLQTPRAAQQAIAARLASSFE